MDAWAPVAKSDLGHHFPNDDRPPPLVGEHVNDTWAWALVLIQIAFIPVFLMIPVFPAIAVAFVINSALVLLDNETLKKCGHPSNRLLAIGLFLVPVYLFARAHMLKQFPSYGWSWLAVWLLSGGAVVFQGGGI